MIIIFIVFLRVLPVFQLAVNLGWDFILTYILKNAFL